MYIADILVSFESENFKSTDLKRLDIVDKIVSLSEQDPNKLSELAHEMLKGRKTLHWILAFPEIMSNGGFHAIVGNPPFLGGRKN